MHRPHRISASAISGVLILVIAVFVPVPTAWAAASITVEPSTASPGDSVTVAGNVPFDGCPASDPAQLTSTADLFPPDGFGPQASRDATGNFSADYTIPASTPLGVYNIGIRCGGGNVGVSAELHIAAVATSSSTSNSPSATSEPPTTSATATTTRATATATASNSSTSASSSKSSALPWILLAIAVVAGAVIAVVVVRRRA